jgi:hypothetical protein
VSFSRRPLLHGVIEFGRKSNDLGTGSHVERERRLLTNLSSDFQVKIGPLVSKL